MNKEVYSKEDLQPYDYVVGLSRV